MPGNNMMNSGMNRPGGMGMPQRPPGMMPGQNQHNQQSGGFNNGYNNPNNMNNGNGW